MTETIFSYVPFWQKATSEQVQKHIDDGLDVNEVDDNGFTPLMHNAMWNRNAEITEILIKNGADIETLNKFKGNALMIAADVCNVDVIECLLKHGADATIKDDDDRTAADYVHNGRMAGFYEEATPEEQAKINKLLNIE